MHFSLILILLLHSCTISRFLWSKINHKNRKILKFKNLKINAFFINYNTTITFISVSRLLSRSQRFPAIAGNQSKINHKNRKILKFKNLKINAFFINSNTTITFFSISLLLPHSKGPSKRKSIKDQLQIEIFKNLKINAFFINSNTTITFLRSIYCSLADNQSKINHKSKYLKI